MAKIDKVKESIGYYKVIFSILIAVDISIVGWLFQHYSSLDSSKIVYSSLMIIFITICIIFVNEKKGVKKRVSGTLLFLISTLILLVPPLLRWNAYQKGCYSFHLS